MSMEARGIMFHATGVIGGLKFPDMGAGNQA